MLKISNIKIYEDLSDNELLNKIVSKYNIKKSDILDFRIIKKSIDARKKNDIQNCFFTLYHILCGLCDFGL